MNSKNWYYDWNKTLTYNADVTMVVGARGIGKTYGLRLVFIDDYIKRGYRFFEIVRYKNQLSEFIASYFRKINDSDMYKNYLFKTQGRTAYIAKKPVNDKLKPQWEEMGYFGCLSEMQIKKNITFSNVRNILFDEAIIDKQLDQFHNYLRNEYFTLAGFVNTVTRENSELGYKPRVFLLGNAVDFMNPYFMIAKVKPDVSFGYHWYRNKSFLLHYVQNEEYSQYASENTVAGRMLKDTIFEDVSSNNIFIDNDEEYIEKKSKNAKFKFGIVYRKKVFGVWLDKSLGIYYVTSKIPNNTNEPTYSITLEDDSISYVNAKKASGVLDGMIELHYYGCLRYENIVIKRLFYEVLNVLGVR